jgi:hypothetical protein
VFGLPFLAAREIVRRVEEAVVSYHRRQAIPPVAGPEEIDAHLDAFFDEIIELTESSRHISNLDERIVDACARAEEWTA